MNHLPQSTPKNMLLKVNSLLMLLTLFAAQALAATPPSFADLAEKLGPSVVNVYTTQVVKAPHPLNDFFHGEQNLPEQFRRFFQLPERNGEQPPREMKRTSLGSGIIIDKDGHIITNNHVVENATEINIRLTNLKEYQATIIGRDPKTDLALLKIEADETLQPVRFGNSDALRVGDWVLAIGNPFGFEQTVTAGIVSGKGRHLGGMPYENFIQTDASINPGNSGGPLFDLDGNMVGVNTAIYSQSGGNIGIGFAIPVNMAKNVLTQLKEHGHVVRGWLGVMIQQVTPELASQFGMERPIGALVGEVSPGSPAAKADIQVGDIITRFNGKEITQMSMLPSMVAQTPVDSKAELVLFRKGKQKEITVIIGKLQEDQAIFGATESPESGASLGITVQELTPELADSLGIEAQDGLLVTAVEAASPAGEAGIKRGDLILEINQKTVTDIDTYRKAMKTAGKEKSVLFLIKRDRHTRYVVVKNKGK